MSEMKRKYTTLIIYHLCVAGSVCVSVREKECGKIAQAQEKRDGDRDPASQRAPTRALQTSQDITGKHPRPILFAPLHPSELLKKQTLALSR